MGRRCQKAPKGGGGGSSTHREARKLWRVGKVGMTVQRLLEKHAKAQGYRDWTLYFSSF